MKAITLLLTGVVNKLCMLFILTLISILFFSSPVQAQFPFIQRKVWDGPYDIKMIAAPSLQAVYLNSSEAANGNLKADSLIRHSTMIMSGKNVLDINNDYKGGNPFVQVDIPLPAILCPDPNAACMIGLNPASPSSSCPVKYNDPLTISKYVSMTYADYDNDVTTYSSSMAQLDISSCSEIEAAYLYWTGAFKGGNPSITLVPTSPFNSYSGNGNVFSTSTTSGQDKVSFKIPGGTYQTVTSLQTRNDASRYLCVADVTSMVQGTGSGQFWVGNIQSYPNEDAIGGGGSSCGWVLVVVFRSPLSPPRLISLWDGLQSINKNSSQTFTLTGLQTPSTSNFKSYVGFAALDGENLAGQLADQSSPDNIPEGLGFQTNAGGALYDINPFKTDQPHYRLWNKKGVPAQSNGSTNVDGCKTPLFDANWASVYDGVSSSHITTYDPVTGTNGNEIIRLPNNPNTLGLDAHHMILPAGAVAPGATAATLTVKAGPQGGTTPFLAYIAIERLQPKLVMTKSANKNTTGLNTQITYTLRIKNLGNDKSLGGDIVYDTLDPATTFVSGSLVTTSYVKNQAPVSAGVTLVSSAANNLQIKINQVINAGDSIDIVFKVQVKDYASNVNLWDVQCKRSITNTAYIDYNTISSGILQSKSNANDCGIGSETKILIFDAQLNASQITNLGPFDASLYKAESVLSHIQSAIINAGVALSDVSLYDIRDAAYNRIRPTDIFPATSPVIYYAIRDFSSAGNCQKIYAVTFTITSLPVKWVAFSGRKEGEVNAMTWSTDSEQNNDYFIIERSINGIDFFFIGTVQGHGNSASLQVYRFLDEQPLNGTNYYRLKQVDVNGAFSYSNMITIVNEQADICVFPNPNHGEFTISFSAPAKFYKLYITDVLGRMVYSNFGETKQGSVEVDDLASGIYMIRFFFGNNVIVKKMMVY